MAHSIQSTRRNHEAQAAAQRSRLEIDARARLVVLLAFLGLLAAAPAARAQLDLKSSGSLLVAPFLTDLSIGQETFLSVTNGETSSRLLHFVFVEGLSWNAVAFDCRVRGRETTLLKIAPSPPAGIRVDYECTKADGGSEQNSMVLQMTEGFVVVTAKDLETGLYDKNVQLFGGANVIGFSEGSALSLPAWAFRGGVGIHNASDKAFLFDGVEYEVPHASMGANFRAPDAEVQETKLILVALDGTVGAGPDADLAFFVYDDDENVFSASYAFSCFSVVSLTDISPLFGATLLGSDTGHMIMDVLLATQSNTTHDATWNGGQGLDGIRRVPVVGWIVEKDMQGASGRRLFESVDRLAPAVSDVPVFVGP